MDLMPTPFDKSLTTSPPWVKTHLDSLPDCGTCPISKLGIYAPTFKSSPDRVSRHRLRAETYQPNQTILRQGQASELFGSIRSGWTYFYKTLTDGRRHIQGFLIPGDTVALDLLLIGANPVSFGVRAVTETTVCWFPVEYMKRLTQVEGAQQEETQLWMSYYLWTLTHRAAMIAHGNAISVVAEFILELSSRERHRGLVKGDIFDFPPTQANIADCLGLTPVHVNRVLADLRKRDILEIKDRTLRIFNERELRRIAAEEQ